MKLSDLSVAQQEQIVSMRKEGRTVKEIITFYKDSYGFNLLKTQVDRSCKGEDILKEFSKPGKRGYNKKAITQECKFKAICKFSEICKLEICKFRGENI